MKLSKQTLAVLKNFSTINQGILIRPGAVIRTKSTEEHILAQCMVDDDFPVEAPIYDLNEFLSTVSLFKDPELDFRDDYVTIREGKASVRYHYSEEDLVVAAPAEVNFPEADVSLKITQEQLSSLLKAANVLSLDTLTIVKEGNVTKATVTDAKNGSSNDFELEVECDYAEDFSVNVRIEHIKIVPQNYNVNILLDAFIQFEGDGLSYWIALDE